MSDIDIAYLKIMLGIKVDVATFGECIRGMRKLSERMILFFLSSRVYF